MRLQCGLLLWLTLACHASPERAGPTPGAELVLDYGRTAGLAWSPLWCRTWSSVRPETCRRMLPDSSQVGFQWRMTGRPHEFTHNWNRVSPLRAFELRDSIRRDLTSWFRWITEHPGPADPEHRMHGWLTKWCLDSAVVFLHSS